VSGPSERAVESDDVTAILPGPDRITLYVCDGCGRREFSQVAIKPGHYSHGERCGGMVHPVPYVKGCVRV
jgi:hypothetical protein